ncbi:GEVED domain-containing protein [Epilithonimonas mollis]|uniref:Por secretion system C-terminal sorting domain-containing protein n=1 Tax=Epilithonimonas mollis TaxID=216903 RepID=A0A1M6P557_9FLAO|nr:GEVED domain-containing protein [Epilithonimonas mollis]SHK03026.1 Por secretion system C-terminal sorting domain-containing protein [Epilithonimonas mollis]
MKKILFSCLLALGIGVNAQYDFSQDFESDDLTGWTFFGAQGTAGFNTVNFCSGARSGVLNYSTATPRTGWMAELLDISDFTGQTDNGQKVNVTFKYKKATGLTGTLYVMYAKQDDETGLWTIYPVGTGVSLTSGAVTTCGTVTGSIPAGTFDPEGVYGIGTWLEATGGTSGALYVDDIVVKQEIATAVPNCTAFTYPTNGSTVAAGTVGFTWTGVENAAKYKLMIGTTSGASDVLNTTVIGSVNVVNTPLLANTTYYAKVVPTNNVGDAVGCQEITFTTNSTVGHCGPLTSIAPTAIAPIKSVTFAGVTNTSDASAVGIGSFPVHQNFTNIEFPVLNTVSTLPLSVTGNNNTNPANGWAISVFIDWNNDGDFDDAGESYFNTTPTMRRTVGVPSTVTVTGDITIPSGVAFGKKTMRIKYNFSGTTIHPSLETACGNMQNGQVEDYTIDYKDALAVSDVNKGKISIFPNPFKDVLNISDVKGVKSISVSDISGREVKSLAPAAELNLSSLKTGLYIVNLKMEDGSVKTFKAIKK